MSLKTPIQPSQYTGIDTLPTQIITKLNRKGFVFNILLVGRSGLGKSTLVNSIFSSHLSNSNKSHDSSKTTEITHSSHLLTENNVKIKLSITDTPGFGDLINNDKAWEPISKYIKDQYSLYLRRELTPAREKSIQDTRVHAVIYFLSPSCRGLLPLDILALKELSLISNVIPVIAKSDTLTLEERNLYKIKIKEELLYHHIHVYPDLQDLDMDEEDPNQKILNDSIISKIPWAVIGSERNVVIDGKAVPGRRTRWGLINIQDESHCEFMAFRTFLLTTHMQDLIETTALVHYETFRTKQLMALKESTGKKKMSDLDSLKTKGIVSNNPFFKSNHQKYSKSNIPHVKSTPLDNTLPQPCLYKNTLQPSLKSLKNSSFFLDAQSATTPCLEANSEFQNILTKNISNIHDNIQPETEFESVETLRNSPVITRFISSDSLNYQHQTQISQLPKLDLLSLDGDISGSLDDFVNLHVAVTAHFDSSDSQETPCNSSNDSLYTEKLPNSPPITNIDSISNEISSGNESLLKYENIPCTIVNLDSMDHEKSSESLIPHEICNDTIEPKNVDLIISADNFELALNMEENPIQIQYDSSDSIPHEICNDPIESKNLDSIISADSFELALDMEENPIQIQYTLDEKNSIHETCHDDELDSNINASFCPNSNPIASFTPLNLDEDSFLMDISFVDETMEIENDSFDSPSNNWLDDEFDKDIKNQSLQILLSKSDMKLDLEEIPELNFKLSNEPMKLEFSKSSSDESLQGLIRNWDLNSKPVKLNASPKECKADSCCIDSQTDIIKTPTKVSVTNQAFKKDSVEQLFDIDDIWSSSIFTSHIDTIYNTPTVEKKINLSIEQTDVPKETREKVNESESIKVNESESIFDMCNSNLEQCNIMIKEDEYIDKVNPKDVCKEVTLENLPQNTEILTTKKNVTFGAAWKGELESIRYINDNQVSLDIEKFSGGLLMLQFNAFLDLKLNNRQDKTFKLEITHNDYLQSSAPIFLPAGQSKTHIGFETPLSIDGSSIITIKLLQKTQTTSTFSKLFSNLNGKRDKQFSSTKFSFYNIQDAFKGQKNSSELSTDSMNEWITAGEFTLELSLFKNSVNVISQKTIDLIQNNKAIAAIDVRYIYIPSVLNSEESVLPNSFMEIEEALMTFELSKKVWKKGFLFQKGGDVDNWQKRFYKLVGLELHISQKKLTPSFQKVDFTQLWSANESHEQIDIEYKDKMISCFSFDLEFKDGVVISLAAEKKFDVESWMQALKEAEGCLRDKQIPEWMHVNIIKRK